MYRYEDHYPEMGAGGFPRSDSDFVFYSRLRLLIRPTDHVLDLGAGRGHSATSGLVGSHQLKRLDLMCERLEGVDVDKAVFANPYLAAAHLIGPDGRLPFEDERFDVVHSYSVFEHVTDPEPFAREAARVLKPGGWLVAVTPNKWGYGAVGARVVPERLHMRVLRQVGQVGQEKGREERDVFPTVFRLNTLAALRRAFPEDRFEHCSYAFSPPPAYTGGYTALAAAFRAWEWLLPATFSRSLHVFIRKRRAA